MSIGKSIRKFRRNMRAISPVIATLLMIAIAVVASLVTYAWVMGYMSFTQEKTGRAIQIQSVTKDDIYIQNVGDSAVSFSTSNAVFVDGVAVGYTVDVTNPVTNPLAKGATATISLDSALTASTTAHTIKVTTTDGTFSQVTKIISAP